MTHGEIGALEPEANHGWGELFGYVDLPVRTSPRPDEDLRQYIERLAAANGRSVQQALGRSLGPRVWLYGSAPLAQRLAGICRRPMDAFTEHMAARRWPRPIIESELLGPVQRPDPGPLILGADEVEREGRGVQVDSYMVRGRRLRECEHYARLVRDLLMWDAPLPAARSMPELEEQARDYLSRTTDADLTLGSVNTETERRQRAMARAYLFQVAWDLTCAPTSAQVNAQDYWTAVQARQRSQLTDWHWGIEGVGEALAQWDTSLRSSPSLEWALSAAKRARKSGSMNGPYRPRVIPPPTTDHVGRMLLNAVEWAALAVVEGDFHWHLSERSVAAVKAARPSCDVVRVAGRLAATPEGQAVVERHLAFPPVEGSYPLLPTLNGLPALTEQLKPYLRREGWPQVTDDPHLMDLVMVEMTGLVRYEATDANHGAVLNAWEGLPPEARLAIRDSFDALTRDMSTVKDGSGARGRRSEAV